jgi:hypothetical protein
MRTLALLLGTLLAMGQARSQTLALSVDAPVIDVGELVTVEVRVDTAVQDLRGYSLDIYYDYGRVEPYSVLEGEVLLAHSPTFFYWQEVDDESGRHLHLDNAILGGTLGGSGEGALCYILLRGLTCGVETLRLSNTQLRDMDNAPISCSVDSLASHQVCLVPPLFISTLPDGAAQLNWLPSLNALEYHLWSRDDWSQPWQYRTATTDTSWVDPETPFLGKRFYQLTLLQN